MSLRNKKTEEELNKLSTKRLLTYLKAERRRFYSSGYFCDCGCDLPIWEAYQSEHYLKKHFEEYKNYLNLIRRILNTREHINN